MVVYVYVLRSLSGGGKTYVGLTKDLKRRFGDHNSGKCYTTARFMPWKLEVYVAFDDRRKALRFERYLKQGSGTVFRERHF